MTEAEWLACVEPGLMLDFLDSRLSRRKLALMACASCRHLWRWFTDNRSRAAVGIAERIADGIAEREQALRARSDAEAAAITTQRALDELKTARERSGDPDQWPSIQEHWALYMAALAAPEALLMALGEDMDWPGMRRSYHLGVCLHALGEAAGYAAVLNLLDAEIEDPGDAWDDAYRSESAWQCTIVREITGNPFRPVTIETVWRTSTVRSLGQAIYDERAFDRLPILADALEDAGCDQADLLAHCRGPGPHCRGCFVIDLVLGKE